LQLNFKAMQTEKKFFAPSPSISIYAPQDLSKNWYCEYYLNGKRFRKYGRINRQKTRPDRMRAARALKRRLEKELTKPISRVGASLENYLELRKNSLSERTLESYQSKIRIYVKYCQGCHNIKTTRAFFDHIQRTRSASTYNTYITYFSALFRGAGLDDLLPALPGKVRARKEPARYFQGWQIEKLKPELQARPPLWLCVQLLYYCFIRPGESRRLRVGDIEGDRIRIRAEIAKNGKNARVAVPRVFEPALSAAVAGRPPGAWLFPSFRDNPRPVGRNTFNRQHSQILQTKNWGPGYSLYSWKHTGVINMVQSGINIKQLQFQLRHHSLDEVQGYLRQLGLGEMVDIRLNVQEL
jgi:integrase